MGRLDLGQQKFDIIVSIGQTQLARLERKPGPDFTWSPEWSLPVGAKTRAQLLFCANWCLQRGWSAPMKEKLLVLQDATREHSRCAWLWITASCLLKICVGKLGVMQAAVGSVGQGHANCSVCGSNDIYCAVFRCSQNTFFL